jgi:NAD(P)H-nitrite reductase large subunit
MEREEHPPRDRQISHPTRQKDRIMATFCSHTECDTCPAQVICYCMHVTEDKIVDALQTLGLRTVREVRHQTRAGDGCTACHRRIQGLIDENSYDAMGCGTEPQGARRTLAAVH